MAQSGLAHLSLLGWAQVAINCSAQRVNQAGGDAYIVYRSPRHLLVFSTVWLSPTVYIPPGSCFALDSCRTSVALAG